LKDWSALPMNAEGLSWRVPRADQLPADARKAAALAAKRGDQQARNRLVESHLWLLEKVAEKRRLTYSADVWQDGVLGLYKAIDKWDPRRGVEFSTVAYWWVYDAMSKSVEREGNRGMTGRREDLQETRTHSIDAMRSHTESWRLDAGGAGVGRLALRKPSTLAGRISQGLQARNQANGGHALEQSELKRRVAAQLDRLPKLEREIVRLRFGLGPEGREYGCKAIAAALGISRVRLLRATRRALRRLKVRLA
jgi:RNA polymerase sigma factor (sigma-70 family)